MTTQLTPNDRAAILKALGFEVFAMRCQSCDVRLEFTKCMIMPPVNTEARASFLCPGSATCLAKYIEMARNGEVEEEDDGLTGMIQSG